jgi:hypothetical protein
MKTSPRPFGSLVALAAAYFINEGIYQLMLIGSCSTPAGPGETPCPPGSEKYFFFLFFGIIVAMGGIFAGGSWLAFLSIFAAIGIGAIRAGGSPQAPDDSGWYYLFGLTFLLTPLTGLIALPFVGLSRLRRARLLSGGHAGTGTVLAIGDTGVTINGNPRVRLTFRIEPSDGVTPPFEATKTTTVSRVHLPRLGDRYPVWFDPDDHDTWAFTSGPGATPVEQPGLRRLVELAKRGAQPGIPAPQPRDVVGELTKLNELRLNGTLTAEEFASRTEALLRA